MTPFAIVVRWSSDPTVDEARDLLRPLQDLCSDGIDSVAVPGAALAFGLRTVVPGETLATCAVVDRVRRRVIVGDVTLFAGTERSEIAGGDLGSGTESDLGLILRAYDRFGTDFVTRLAGDFAFVIWDWERRKVVAARDHFGMRTLYLRKTLGGLAFGTDVRQLLLLDSMDREVDSNMALDYLLRDFAHSGRSFFRNIRQIRPAHLLTEDSARSSEEAYWKPCADVVRLARYEEYVEEWRRLFRISVAQRLRSAHPIAAHLSGGLDSGSVVATAHEIYEADSGRGSPFFTLSAEFPGMAWDEEASISAVLKRVPRFVPVRWDASVPNFADLEHPMIAAPGLLRGLGGGPSGDLQSARERGARVLLTGFGGDELFWAGGVFRDLVAHRQWRTLYKELAAFPSRARAKAELLDGLRGITLVRSLAALRDRFSGRAPRPDWLGPDLASLFPGAPDDRDPGDFIFSSHVQRELWRVLHLPQIAIFIEFFVLAARERGIELRMPFLDVRLAQFVLSIPWEFRFPHGQMRRLERDGVRDLLPPTVVDKPKLVFGSAWARHADSCMPRIREIFHDPGWRSGGFVDQTAAQRLLTRIEREQVPDQKRRDLKDAWTIASFEVWLRAIREYTAAPRSP